MIKRLSNYLITLVGISLSVCGSLLIKNIDNPEGIFKALPYIFIGIGCGIFSNGMGKIINSKAMANNPQIKKQQEIELNDERNLIIQYKAKAKAYDMMIYVFGALMLSFALMNADMMIILMLVISYLFVIGYGIYYRVKYDKEM